jgi:hypothetical protein
MPRTVAKAERNLKKQMKKAEYRPFREFFPTRIAFGAWFFIWEEHE